MEVSQWRKKAMALRNDDKISTDQSSFMKENSIFAFPGKENEVQDNIIQTFHV